jgi:hypothetical protein
VDHAHKTNADYSDPHHMRFSRVLCGFRAPVFSLEPSKTAVFVRICSHSCSLPGNASRCFFMENHTCVIGAHTPQLQVAKSAQR